MRRGFSTLLLGASAAWSSCAGTSLPPADAGDGSTGLPDASYHADGGDPADAGLPVDLACAAWNDARCAFLQRCGLVESGDAGRIDCLAWLGATFCGATLWPAWVTAGTLRYEPLYAEACADSFDALECRNWRVLPAACLRALAPRGQLGDSCFGGAYPECQAGVCRGLTCPRHCQLPAWEGTGCEKDADCSRDGGFYCRQGLLDVSGTCRAPSGPGDGCADGARCGPGLYCDAQALCAARAPLTAPCAATPCVETAFCATPTDGGTAVCSLRRRMGAFCERDEQCESELVCVEETGRCGAAAGLTAGAWCGARQACAAGLACVGLQPGSAGQCGPPRSEGVPCGQASDCAESLTCDLARFRPECTRRFTARASCATDDDCQLLLTCAGGSCTPRPRLGEPCRDVPCLWGACRDSFDGGTCGPRSVGNDACRDDAECESGRCLSGYCLPACRP